MVDAEDSKSSVRKDMPVQVRPPAPNKMKGLADHQRPFFYSDCGAPGASIRALRGRLDLLHFVFSIETHENRPVPLPPNIRELKGRWVIYVYPMTGRPGVPLPDGWDGIPGARGCTPQSCNFRDHYSELKALNTGVFGLSTQHSEYQREARDRLHLPFELLSDSGLQLKDALRLPTFTVAGMELYKRLTLVTRDGHIEKVFYPVFPPDQNADQVLTWLRENTQPGAAGGTLQVTRL